MRLQGVQQEPFFKWRERLAFLRHQSQRLLDQSRAVRVAERDEGVGTHFRIQCFARQRQDGLILDEDTEKIS